MSVAWVGAGIAAVSAISSAKASKKAAGQQAAAADDATALQREQFDKQIELQEPFRQTGMAANNKLATLLGLELPKSAYQTADNFNAGKYLALNPDAQEYMRTSGRSAYDHFLDDGSRREGDFWNNQPANARNDPAFGSLARDFSMADYQADPGYQFRLSEGEKGLQRAASAAGRSDSGRAYKDLMRFNSGLASQEYGSAFDRFQANRASKLNPLQAMSGSGQTSANALGQASENYAANAGANIVGAGNARAAGTIGGATAINSGIGTGWNMYQNNALMNKLFPSASVSTPPTRGSRMVPDYPGAEY